MQGGVAIFVCKTETGIGAGQQHLWSTRKNQVHTHTHTHTYVMKQHEHTAVLKPQHKLNICVPRAPTLPFSAAIISEVRPDWSAASTGASWDRTSWRQSTWPENAAAWRGVLQEKERKHTLTHRFVQLSLSGHCIDFHSLWTVEPRGGQHLFQRATLT